MTATDSLAAWLAGHDPDHSDAFHRRMAGRVVANWKLIGEWVREEAQGPDRVKLRQQRGLELDDQDAWLEEAKEAHDRLHFAVGVLRALGSPYVDRFSPDERDAVRQDQRDTEAAHDQAAADNAPRVAS